jgi:hypothetical protein
MTIPVPKVSLDCTSLDYIDVSWTIPSTGANLLELKYTVLRGEASGGPFEAIIDGFIDRYSVRDYIAPRKTAWRSLYYVVKVTNTNTNEEAESEPQSLRARPPLDALEMIRLNSLLYKEFVGRPSLIFPIRTFGQNCVNCYDALTQRRMVSFCKTCYNTGFSRGYHYPIYAYIQITPEQQVQQNTDTIITRQAQVQARMSIYPILKIGDLIIEREGTRWRVQGISFTERLRSPVQQLITLFRIPEGDVEYNLPVTWSEDVSTSPRSFKTRSDL